MTEERVSLAAGADRDAAIGRAVALLRRDGVVVLDDVVDPALVAQCRTEIEAAYPELARPDRERNYGPYEGRHTMPMRIAGTLADPAIFLPCAIEEIAGTVLERRFLFDSLGLLVSIPGAPDQVAHADAQLYPETRIDHLVPPFAIAFALPLVPMDETSGRTAFWRRSHRAPDPAGDYDLAPVMLPGSAMLWDYRLHHCGQANRGDTPRPVIFSALSRQWWTDMHPPEATRYEKLLVARPAYDALKPRLQRRLGRATLVD